MHDNYYRIIDLLRHYAKGEATEDEIRMLTEALGKHPEFWRLFDGLDAEHWKKRHALEREICKEKALRAFDRRIGYHHLSLKRFFRYAAVFILPLIGAWWIWSSGQVAEESSELLSVLPGKLQAQLTLANGEVVALGNQDYPLEIPLTNNLKGTSVGGMLNYSNVVEPRDEVGYNTLEVPRGGMFKVVLTDGTVVHLNAETRLTYPIVFGKEKRMVFLDGEAYFEVSRDTIKPFLVQAGELSVRVYGTTFNVNTYQDKCVQTTLVEGKVGITSPTGQETMISPNEMAEYNLKENTIRVKVVNPRLFTAWRFGEFMFEEESLENIMDQLARWYDVEVFYTDELVKDFIFSGIADRFSDVMSVLEILECTGVVEFSVKGRVIMVKSTER